MNRAMRRTVRYLARQVGALTITTDQLGRELEGYAGVPLGVVEGDVGIPGFTGTLLPFSNEGITGKPATTSIYTCTFGPETMHGIQTAPISVRDPGETDAKPALRTRIEWYSGFCIKHPQAVSRLKGLTQSHAVFGTFPTNDSGQ